MTWLPLILSYTLQPNTCERESLYGNICPIHPCLNMPYPNAHPNRFVLKISQICLTWLHHISQIHNNILRDWEYSTKYSWHSNWMWRILSFPHNIVMDLNNVMYFGTFGCLLVALPRILSYTLQPNTCERELLYGNVCPIHPCLNMPYPQACPQ